MDKVPCWTTDFDAAVSRKDVDAVILASPTQLHHRQAEICMRAGKHVRIEIPMTGSLTDAEHLPKLQRETGVAAMAGHVRRFSPGRRWARERRVAGELRRRQLPADTCFFRRTNIDALGAPRS